MRILFILFILIFINVTTSLAAVITHTGSVPIQTTNYNGQIVSIPQFDLSLGVLDSVFIRLTGTVLGDVKFESLDASPATISYSLLAELELFQPDNVTSILIAMPAYSGSAGVTAFDGTLDFGGTSGRTFMGLSGTGTNSRTYTLPADLAMFTGLGTLSLKLSGTGISNASGSGNIVSAFTTQAGGDILVEYHYHTVGTPVPEPSSFMLVLGLFLTGFYFRKNLVPGKK